jgi:hypothetical protein
MLDVIDPALEWTYRDPSVADPDPQVCRGRHELETALRRQTELGLKARLEAFAGNGEWVMVVVRTPGIDEYRVRNG